MSGVEGQLSPHLLHIDSGGALEDLGDLINITLLGRSHRMLLKYLYHGPVPCSVLVSDELPRPRVGSANLELLGLGPTAQSHLEV